MNAKNTYEAMFLLDAGGPDAEAAMEPVRKVLDRSEAEVLSMKPWDERRLAYSVKGRKRGLYVLSYFKLDPARVREVEHDCELAEGILRVLILRPHHLTGEQIEAETPATASARKAAAREQARAEKAAREAAKDEGAPDEKPAGKKPPDEKPADEKPSDESPESAEPAAKQPGGPAAPQEAEPVAAAEAAPAGEAAEAAVPEDDAEPKPE